MSSSPDRWPLNTSPFRSASPLHPKSPLHVLQVEKDTACLQLSQTKQALLVERSLADAKQEELRGVFDHLHVQLAAEKEASNRQHAERETAAIYAKAERDTLQRRVREAESELEVYKNQSMAADVHMKQKEYELTKFLQQLEEAIQEKDRDSQKLAAFEEELNKTREKLITQTADTEVLTSQLKAEIHEAHVKADGIATQLSMSETDLVHLRQQKEECDEEVTNLQGQIKSLKLEALEKEYKGDASVKRVEEAEALASKRQGQLQVAEQALTKTEDDLQNAKLLISDMQNGEAAAARKSVLMEEELLKAQQTLEGIERLNDKHRMSLENTLAKQKEMYSQLELEHKTLKAGYDQLKGDVSQSSVDTLQERHSLEALLEEARQQAQEALGEVERLNSQLASQAGTSKQVMDTFNERIEREREKARASAADVGVLKTRVSDLQIALQENETSSQLNSSTAASLLDEAKEENTSLRKDLLALEAQLHAKTEILIVREDELAAARRHETEAAALSRRLEEATKRAAEGEVITAALRQQLAATEAAAASDKLMLDSMKLDSNSRAASAEGEVISLKRALADSVGDLAHLRQQIDPLNEALDESRSEVERLKERLGGLHNIELERDALHARAESFRVDLERKTNEAEKLRAQLAVERNERAMNGHEEESLRIRVTELAAKLDPLEGELARVESERDVAMEHTVGLNTTLGHEIARREAAEADVERMRKLAEMSKSSTQRDYEGSIAGLKRKIADMAEELEHVGAARSELVRAVWNLLTELGIARQQFSNVLMTPGLKKSLAKLRPAFDELQKIQESVAKSRQQAKWIVANYLTEVEKMHLGTSEWHFTPAKKRSTSRSTSRAMRSKVTDSSVPSVARSLSKQRSFPVSRELPQKQQTRPDSPIRKPHQVPVTKPELGPYSPEEQRVSIDSELFEALLTPQRKATMLSEL